MKIFLKLLLGLSIVLSADAKAGQDVDFDAMLSKAKKQGTSIMIFFHMNGCEYCEDMLENNFHDEKTLSYIKKHFLHLDININHKEKVLFEGKKMGKYPFAMKYKIFSYPSTVFLDKNGKVVHTAIGYRNIKELLTDLKYVKHQKYKSMKFKDFVSEAEFLDE